MFFHISGDHFGASDQFLSSLSHSYQFSPIFFIAKISTQLSDYVQLYKNLWGERNLPADPPILFLLLSGPVCVCVSNDSGSVGGQKAKINLYIERK